MVTALLLHAYASGLYSSRRIGKACIERADFMMIVAGDPADFRTNRSFANGIYKPRGLLFVQVLRLAEGWPGDARARRTRRHKIKANASKHKAMSYDRMKKREAERQAEVDGWLAAAEAADAEENKLYGDKRGDEMPDWIADKQKRIEKIRAAKAELDPKAKAAAAEETRQREEAEQKRIAESRKKNGRTPAPAPGRALKAKRSATSPTRTAAYF
jgi:hypothetical protein